MPLGPNSLHSMHQRWLLCLLLLCAMTLCSRPVYVAAAASPDPRSTDQPTTSAHASQDDFCAIDFADSFFASIATTMPIAGRSPLAQTGHLYVDRAAGAARIDQFFRNHRTTFLLDNRRLRGFLFFGDRDFQPTKAAASEAARAAQTNGAAPDNTHADYSQNEEEVVEGKEGAEESQTDGDAEVRQRCHVFYLPRKVTPFCVPRAYAAGAQQQQQQAYVVRGVPTTRFSGIERYPNMPLVEQSLYVVNTTAMLHDGVEDTVEAAAVSAFTPWRLEYRARSDLEPQTIAAAPYTMPNWRFFGHPMFDEMTLSSAQESRLQLWQPSVDLMTIDFYDYYVTEHAEDVFAVPPQCTAVLRSDPTGSRPRAAAEGEGGGESLPQLQLATIQRFLLQWHLLQNASMSVDAPL